MKQYKTEFIRSTIEQLDDKLNEYAQDGWIVKSIVKESTGTIAYTMTFLCVFERELLERIEYININNIEKR